MTLYNIKQSSAGHIYLLHTTMREALNVNKNHINNDFWNHTLVVVDFSCA